MPNLTQLPQLATITANTLLYAVYNGADYKVEAEDLLNAQISSQRINTVTGTTYVVKATDDRTIIETTNSADVIITVPETDTLVLPVGFQFVVTQIGTGQAEIRAMGGDLLYSKSNMRKITARYAAITVYKRVAGDPNQWVILGDLTE